MTVPAVIPPYSIRPNHQSYEVHIVQGAYAYRLECDGIAEQLRYRIIVATLTRKPIVISNIREDDENPGLKGRVVGGSE